MEAGDADAFLGAGDFNFEPAAGGEWQLVLGDLVALGEVRVEIVLSGEAGMVVDGAVERERGAHGHFDGALV